MRTRYTIDDEGLLVDRDGNALGRVVGITIDDSKLSPRGSDRGDIGGLEEKRTSELQLQGGPGAPKFDPALEVWKHYVQVMKPRSAGLDDQRRRVIKDALKAATIDECKTAIDGCAASSFHMGQNDRGKKYNALSQILKGKRGIRTTREQIDMFLEIAEKAGRNAPVSSAGGARIAQAKQDVRDAAEFPGDEGVVARGNEAKAWLESLGWTVDMNAETPTFSAP